MIDLSKVTPQDIEAEIASLRAHCDGEVRANNLEGNAYTADLLEAVWTQLCHARRAPEPSLLEDLRWHALAAKDSLAGNTVRVAPTQAEMTGPLNQADIPEATRHLDMLLGVSRRMPPAAPLRAYPDVTIALLTSIMAETGPGDRSLSMGYEDRPGRYRAIHVCSLGQIKGLAAIAFARLAGATLACDDLRATQEKAHGKQDQAG